MRRGHVHFRLVPLNPVQDVHARKSFLPRFSSFLILTVKIILYAVVTVLVLGALYYFLVQSSSLKPMADSRAAEALTLVQTHRAQGYPTILQAMTEHVRSMSERNLVARLGEWRVKQLEGNLYEVRIQLRDQGVTGQWFEREFIWHADLSMKKVNAASLPADGITPKEPDAAT